MIRHLLHFGDCSLDIAARELRRGGLRVDLPPIVFDCIAYLAEQRERAVGRDELVSAVWGKTAISDTMLGKAILAARRAIGDTAEAQTLLRTVPRFGYHWVATTQVEAVDDSISQSPSLQTATALPFDTVSSTTPEDAADGATPRIASSAEAARPAEAAVAVRTSRRLAALVAGLAIIAAVTAIALFNGPSTPQNAPSSSSQAPANAVSMAVLPADVLADSADAWMRLGLMDLIATRLRDAGLGVVSSDSVVRLIPAGTSTEAAVAAARRTLDAGRLLLPAVRHSGATWTVRVELIDADGQRRSVQGEADTAIAAAGAASDQVLAALGKRPATTTAAAADLSLAELLQRSDAARLGEDIELARSILAHAPAAMQALPEVRMRGIRIDLRAGEFERARSASTALLAEVPAEQDPVLHARILENLCVAQLRLGQLDQARRACDASIGLLETRDEPLALGRAYSQRGIIHSRLHEREAALADFARARIALTVAGDPLLLTQLDGNESTVEMVNGHPAEALPTLERAGRNFQRFGMVNEFVIALVNRVDANLMLLQPVAALKASDEGWAQRSRISDPQVRHSFQQRRADALAANGRLSEARVVLDELIHETGPAPDAFLVAAARASQARLDLANGQPATAAVLSAQAMDGLAAPELMPQRGSSWLTQIRALIALARNDEAGRELAAMTAWAGEQPSIDVALSLQLAAAEQAAALRHADAATGFYAAATALANQRRIPDTQVEVAVSYAGFLIGSGELERASGVVGTIGRHAERDFDSALIEARLFHALGREPAWRNALTRARQLAGERAIPAVLLEPPASTPLAASR